MYHFVVWQMSQLSRPHFSTFFILKIYFLHMSSPIFTCIFEQANKKQTKMTGDYLLAVVYMIIWDDRFGVVNYFKLQILFYFSKNISLFNHQCNGMINYNRTVISLLLLAKVCILYFFFLNKYEIMSNNIFCYERSNTFESRVFYSNTFWFIYSNAF